MTGYTRAALYMAAVLFLAVLLPAGAVTAGGVSLDQSAGTTGGSVSRHIDVSSAWSGAYLHEDMKVVGRVEITESFRMDNMRSGSGQSLGFEERDLYPSEAKADPVSGGSGTPGTESPPQPAYSASEKGSSPAQDKVLGVTIVAVPGWFDLF